MQPIFNNNNKKDLLFYLKVRVGGEGEKREWLSKFWFTPETAARANSGSPEARNQEPYVGLLVDIGAKHLGHSLPLLLSQAHWQGAVSECSSWAMHKSVPGWNAGAVVSGLTRYAIRWTSETHFFFFPEFWKASQMWSVCSQTFCHCLPSYQTTLKCCH